MNTSDYMRGYTNGQSDRLSGLRSIIALTSPNRDYAAGYADGVAGRPSRF